MTDWSYQHQYICGKLLFLDIDNNTSCFGVESKLVNPLRRNQLIRDGEVNYGFVIYKVTSSKNISCVSEKIINKM